MQAVLKTIVTLLGVLILIGLGLLGFGFMKIAEDPNWRLFGSASESVPEPPTAEAEAAPEPPTLPLPVSQPAARGWSSETPLSVTLDLPQGCRIHAISEIAGQLAVQTEPREAGTPCGSVFLIDPASGGKTGQIAP